MVTMEKYLSYEKVETLRDTTVFAYVIYIY